MSVDLNALRQEFQRIQSQGQNTSFLDNFLKLPDGEGSITVRILPATDGCEGLPCAKTRTHKLNGKTFHSPLKLVNGKWLGNCPINNYYRDLWKRADAPGVSDAEAKSLIAEARAIKPVERFYCNVIVRNFTDKDGKTHANFGPKIYSFGKQVWDKILRAICGSPEVDEPGLGDVTDLQNGRDFKIIKRLVKGGGGEAYPNYNESKFLGVSPAGTDEEIARWMDARHDLRSLITIKSFDELAREVRIHRGLEKDSDTSFDTAEMDDEAPVPTKPTVHVDAAPPKATPPRTTAKVAPPQEDDEYGVGDEFFQRLKGGM